MNLRYIGAAMILAGCGGYGYSMAAAVKENVHLLKQMIRMLERMETELQYRLPPLQELCESAANEAGRILRTVMEDFSLELSKQKHPDASMSMRVVLEHNSNLPGRICRHLRYLGRTLGRYDLSGQLRGIQSVREACETDLAHLRKNQDVRLRSYQTLSLCAGTALVILFV